MEPDNLNEMITGPKEFNLELLKNNTRYEVRIMKIINKITIKKEEKLFLYDNLIKNIGI
jgi:hypothetical protein